MSIVKLTASLLLGSVFVIGLLVSLLSNPKLPFYVELNDMAKVNGFLSTQHLKAHWNTIFFEHELYDSEHNRASIEFKRSKAEHGDDTLTMVVTLLDNSVWDSKHIRFEFPKFEMFRKNDTMAFSFNSTVPITAYSLIEPDARSRRNCTLEMEGSLNSRTTVNEILFIDRFLNKNDVLTMNVKSEEPGCKGFLHLTAHAPYLNSLTVRYLLSWLVVSVSLFNLIGLVSTYKTVGSEYLKAVKFSSRLLEVNFFQEIYLMVFYIQFLFPQLGSILPFFLSYSIFCANIYFSLTLWGKLRQAARIESPGLAYGLRHCRQLTITSVLGGLYIWAMTQWPLSFAVVALNCGVLFFQIAKNRKLTDTPILFKPYICMSVLPKYLVYGYFRGLGSNLLGFRAHTFIIASCIALLGISVGLLWLQSRFIKRKLAVVQPKKAHYQYLVKLSTLSKTSSCQDLCSFEADPSSFDMTNQFCSICYEDLNRVPALDKNNYGEKGTLSDTLRKAGDSVMQTPCEHVFHPECLLVWMQVKMVCPYCKAPLPVFTRGEDK